MNFSTQSRRSSKDPTWLTLPHTSWCDAKLFHAHSQLAKAQAHRQFVTTCLRSNTIPWGLCINTRPHVPSQPDTTILKKTTPSMGENSLTSIYQYARGLEGIPQELWATSETIHHERKDQGYSSSRTVEVRRHFYKSKDRIHQKETKIGGETKKETRFSWHSTLPTTNETHK